MGRDVSAAEGSNAMAIASGLAVQRSGSNAAYDMKSLGKHIEAVSQFPSFFSAPGL
jgi:hypothetical protein